ncbi:MAG: isochorismatase hydrolase [uncultured bacterium]|nr:MAG: isochorismatase hydrolase [uncultured bacterium]HBH19268.1 isochorismatase [Cyanobacteria bacterium UBA9579]
MKESYFTKENIRERAELLLNQFRKSKKHKDIAYSPELSALIVMDMQGYFLNPESHAYIPASRAIIANIQALIESYKRANLPVIFTRHINTRLNAGLMSEWWDDVITENNGLSEIIPELELTNSVVIEKTQYDAFYKTNLEELLNNHNVKQVVITGVMTHLCCETTVRSAFVRGFKPFMPIDATATYNEEFHKATFKNLSHGFTSPVVTRELLEFREKHS